MGKTKQAPVDEVEDDELEELDEDEAEDTAPAKKGGGAPAVTFGVADLAAYLSKKTGKEIKAKELRTLIRKMAREDNARVDREIVAGNKSRYDWKDGLEDPEVKAIVKAVTKGELEEGKKEALAKLKEQKAAKAAAGTKSKAGKKGKKAAKPEPEDDDVEEIEDFDED